MKPGEFISRIVGQLLPFTPQESAADSNVRYQEKLDHWKKLLAMLRVERFDLVNGRLTLTGDEEDMVQWLDLGIDSLNAKIVTESLTGPKIRGERRFLGRFGRFNTEIPLSRSAMTDPELTRAI